MTEQFAPVLATASSTESKTALALRFGAGEAWPVGDEKAVAPNCGEVPADGALQDRRPAEDVAKHRAPAGVPRRFLQRESPLPGIARAFDGEKVARLPA